MWSFRTITAIEEPVFNNTLERFYDLGIDGLVRENIQNSLDGKLEGSEAPVVVKIVTGEMSSSDIPGIDEIRAHISTLKGENAYTRETIAHMKAAMNQNSVSYISFEDCNTKGLTGAEHGENYQDGDTWGVYAYKKGVHFTEKNSELENVRGGSHGVGKIASNAASDIHMMFFANCDAQGRQHLGGTTQLIEHELRGKYYRASGYFTKEIGGAYYPYENRFGSIFEKNTRGLKIIIPFLREQYKGIEYVVRAVCDNFFVAILQGKLEVSINGTSINKNTILMITSAEQIYPEQNPATMKECFTPLYIQSYLNYEPFPVDVSDRKREYHFKLYLQYNEEIKRARVAVVRGIGMKIEDKKVKNFVNSPFNGVLLPVSSEEDIFLKSLENESHTQLSYDHIKDPATQKNAKYFLNNLNKAIGEILELIIKQKNPADGKIDTSDVIYATERSFRKELSSEIPTVQLNKGKSGGEKTVVKLKTSTTADKKKKAEIKKKNKLKSVLRKLTKKDGEEEKNDRVRYPMHPESVKRIVLDGKEVLQFDFSEVAQYSGEPFCDISMAVIDGTGKPYETEFSILKSYEAIQDQNQRKPCKVQNNIIKGVSIIENRVRLELQTSAEFNSALKFMYYVEV